jgi:plastocyanin
MTRMLRRTRLLMAACVLGIPIGACSAANGTEVGLDAHSFLPATITVEAGETVTWTNKTTESHSVTAYQDGIPEGAPYFASGGAPSEQAARDDLNGSLIAESETFEFTFDQPGTYRYFCIPHESDGMKGTVVVTKP